MKNEYLKTEERPVSITLAVYHSDTRNAGKISAESESIQHHVKLQINMLHEGGHANHHRCRKDDETAKAKATTTTTTTTTTNHSPE